MITRRTLLATLAGAALLQSTSLAFAQSPLEVNIVALGHWPVQKALDPARALLKTYGDKIAVQEFDAEADDGLALIEGAGQKGHVPLIILINGAYQFSRADGSPVTFLSFPSGEANPLGAAGSWSMDDLKYVLDSQLGG